MPGVLEGLTIIEMAGIGPAPFCGMMLADHGARVIRIDRVGARDSGGRDVLSRNREVVQLDMKSPEGVAEVRELCRTAYGIIEGFRPGVMERMGLGPDVLLADNPKLVFGRMTGWGQTGPLAQAAGHDINYISITGNLHGYGRPDQKPTPTNAIGDFAGGGMMLAFGMVAALLSAHRTGKGQVIDCAMTDGAAVIHAMQWGFRGMGMWEDTRGVNMLDTAAHFYDTYECADGKFISIGSIEPQFYALLRQTLGLEDDPAFDAQMDKGAWPKLKERLTDIFRTKTRDEWAAMMEGTDICFGSILSMAEAVDHPQNRERGTFVEVAGIDQPAPAPRFLGTPRAQAGRAQMMGPPDWLDRLIQALIALVAVFALLNGGFMLGDPFGWYQAVETVKFTGPANPHFIRDIGIAYLASGIMLGFGAVRPSMRWLAVVAGNLWLTAHGVLHVWEVATGVCAPDIFWRDAPGVLGPPLLVWLALTVQGARQRIAPAGVPTPLYMRIVAQRTQGEDTYIREIRRAAGGALEKFKHFQPATYHRHAAPADLFHLARIGATLVEDCGPCALTAAEMALQDGVDRDLINAALRAEPPEGELAIAFAFGGAIAQQSAQADELGDAIEAEHGRAIRFELAMTAATVRSYPAMKRGLGLTQACALTHLEI